MSFHKSVVCSFVWMSSILLYGYNGICLSIHQLTDIWVIYRLVVITNKVAVNIHDQVFEEI